MGRIQIGISAWGDPGLAASGFYPPEASTSQERLRYYARSFSLAETDISYHVIPGPRFSTAWIEATPPDFTFDVRAFSLFTGHPTALSAIPRDLREQAKGAMKKTDHLYLHNLSGDLADEIWQRFNRALKPLQEAGKLGAVMFQFPSWFHHNPENLSYLKQCQARLEPYNIAVEFRTTGWLSPLNQEETLQFLRRHQISLVCVDEPQGLKTSLPPLAEATAGLAVVRFHGRNRENWERTDIPANEKFNYLYTDSELREWAPKIRSLAEKSAAVHLIFKNKHLDYEVRNARSMSEILESKNPRI
jgi:uncharacterized protein YecE (DUF72 family)